MSDALARRTAALLLSLLGENAGYGSLLAGMLILGVGIGLFYSSITTAAVTALDAARAGLAGGIIYMFQIAGGSVGLGLNTTVFTARDNSAGNCVQANGKACEYFNPFTTTPIEGVHYVKGPDFGKPRTATTFVGTSQGDFQLPRTFLMSFGVKF